MTRIRFDDPLIDLVLSGEKDTTWRIWDEKDVEVDEEVSLQDNDGEEFGRAQVLWVKDTTFGRLTEEDCEGHESFDSQEEMFETYEGYYDQDVDEETEVKVIKFELL